MSRLLLITAGWLLIICSSVFSFFGWRALLPPDAAIFTIGVIIAAILCFELVKAGLLTWIVDSFHEYPKAAILAFMFALAFMYLSATGSFKYISKQTDTNSGIRITAEQQVRQLNATLESKRKDKENLQKEPFPTVGSSCDKISDETLIVRCIQSNNGLYSQHKTWVSNKDRRIKDIDAQIEGLTNELGEQDAVVNSHPADVTVFWRSIAFATLLELGALACWMFSRVVARPRPKPCKEVPEATHTPSQIKESFKQTLKRGINSNHRIWFGGSPDLLEETLKRAFAINEVKIKKGISEGLAFAQLLKRTFAKHEAVWNPKPVKSASSDPAYRWRRDVTINNTITGGAL